MSNLTLQLDEHVENRPFSDPEHRTDDLASLRKMAHQLVDFYDDPVICDFVPGKKPICMSDPQGRHFRIYYVRPELLFQAKDITVVGFFGQKRAKASVKPLIQADKRFEAEFPNHPGLLSLSTVRLADGDFANLVLFTDDEAKDQWNYNPLHYETVSKISPSYYASIRLNNGVMPDGLDDPNSLRLTRTRYLDFGAMPPWRALRSYE
jgi:hypothetical protein